jgi:hypothetical protein
MRTTLDIDDDVLFAAKDLARRDKTSIGESVSALLRKALQGKPAGRGRAKTKAQAESDIDRKFRALGFNPLPSRGGVITNELINEIREREGI